MIAGLPMYDRPETEAAHDRFWQAIRASLAGQGIAAPQHLTRGLDLWSLWQDPELILSQTCGMPYRDKLHGQVSLVATPVFDLPCTPGHYFSVMVTRRDDPRRDAQAFDGATLAFNGTDSQSGWGAAWGWAKTQGIRFGERLYTEAHVNSAQAVADGRADIAAIDALTWELIKRWDSSATKLKELAHTRSSPAVPYISARGANTAAIAQALEDAVQSISAVDRQTLCLRGIAHISAETYLSVPNPEPVFD